MPRSPSYVVVPPAADNQEVAAWSGYPLQFEGMRRFPWLELPRLPQPIPRRSRSVLFMIIERFKNRDAKAVYRRFREKGRMAPDGLAYVESWVETNFDRCFQLMECGDVRLLEQWADRWRDLVDFEFVPVRRSKEAAELISIEL